jgi:hypothetical protein
MKTLGYSTGCLMIFLLYTCSISLANELKPYVENYIHINENGSSKSFSYQDYINQSADNVLKSIGAKNFFNMINEGI